jgi:hypothetical protein
MYGGPYGGQANTCICSTIVYSLVSACAGCQGSSWVEYVFCSSRENSTRLTFFQVGNVGVQLYFCGSTYSVRALPPHPMPIPCTTLFLLFALSETSVSGIRTRSQPERVCPTGHILTWCVSPSVFRRCVILALRMPSFPKWHRPTGVGMPSQRKPLVVSRATWHHGLKIF